MVELSARKQAINGKKFYFDMSFVLSVSIKYSVSRIYTHVYEYIINQLLLPAMK